jgi:hypothetical protein
MFINNLQQLKYTRSVGVLNKQVVLAYHSRDETRNNSIHVSRKVGL